MNSQTPGQMELQEARKKRLCPPLRPVPPKKGIYMNREPGVCKSVRHHSAGVTSAYPPFIQKAKFKNPCSWLLSAVTVHSPSQLSAFSYGSKGSGCEHRSRALPKVGATKSSQGCTKNAT